MSGLLNIKGTNQLPKPPTMIGITMKKIIIKACLVTITLYKWSFNRAGPGVLNSKRIIILIAVPIQPDQAPRIKYKVPISLWLVDINHRDSI